MDKINIIFTFNDDPQIIETFRVTKSNIKTEKCFIKWMKSKLTEDQQKELIKISCCIRSNFKPPVFYLNANGKFYFSSNLKRPI